MGSLKGSSSFEKDLEQLDLSWISRLIDEEAASRNTRPSSSSNSCPDQSSSPGLEYRSNWDNINSPPQLPMPPLRNDVAPINLAEVADYWKPTPSEGIVLSQSEGRRQEPVPLWSHPGVVGLPSYYQCIPGGVSYVLKPASQPFMAGSVAYFFLLPGTGPLNPTNHNNVQKLNICARIAHSSGYLSFVKMQKLDKVLGYQCSFVPFFSGKYSANVFIDDDSSAASNLEGAKVNLCSPLELDVSRNYGKEARNPITPPINLDDSRDRFWGISADKFTDKLYVTDCCNSEVIVADPAVGKPVFHFGRCNRFSSSPLFRPTGIAVDKTNKRLLICDKDNHRICIFSMDGNYISSFGNKGHAPCEFNYPWDVDISPNGDIIVVSDSRNHRVQFFDRFGNYLKSFSVFESDPFGYKKRFDYPRGIAFSNDGKTVFVTDFNNNNVVRLVVETLEHKMLVPYGRLNQPEGVVVDEEGNILVCDSSNNCIRTMTSAGNLICSVFNVGPFAVGVPMDSCILREGKVATLSSNGKIHFY